MSAPAPDCLTTLVGLSDGALPCYPLPSDPDAAAAAIASATGYFITDVEGLKIAPAPNAPAALDLYERLAKARKGAARELRTALEAGRAKTAGVPLYQARGTLGGPGNGQLLPLGTRALLTFHTNYKPAGGWRVVDMGLFTDQAVTDAPLLLDGEQVALLASAGSSGQVTGLPAGGFLLPLDGRPHTLEVVLPPAVRVRANNLFAGCYSCQRGAPWFTSVIGVAQAGGGYFGGSLSQVTATTPGNGFSLTIREECTMAPDLLCYVIGSDVAAPDGPRYPELTRYLGATLLYKAAELFTADLLASNATNRYTMLEPKMLLALVENYAAKYSERLAWLNSPDGLGQVKHPCFYQVARGIAKEWTL